MKKINALVLAVILCLSLSACGKSEAAKNVEAMIDALDEITIESIDAIRSAENAYDSLTEKEQKKVGNYKDLAAARVRYYELMLVGKWYDSYIWVESPETNLTRPAYLTLNADKTGVECGDGGIENPFTWSIDKNILTVKFEKANMSYIIEEDNNTIILTRENSDWKLLKEENYFAYIDDVFVFADLSEVDLSEYVGIEILDYAMKDEWGDPTGEHYIHVVLKNMIYDQGWLYLSSSDDFAIEVLYPEHHSIYSSQDGTSWDRTVEAGSYTVAVYPYDFDSGLRLGVYDNDSTVTHDLNVDEMSFGRARGTIVYINSKYVSQVKQNEGGHMRALITDFTGDREIISGQWREGFNY